MLLKPYQQKVLERLLTMPKGALFLKQRLGKTVVMKAFLQEKHFEKMLIVAPYSAFPSWVEDSYFILNVKTKIPATYNIVLTNKESFLKYGDWLKRQLWDCIIIDESTILKNPRSKITKFYTRYFTQVKHKYILSGLPSPNDDMELISQFVFLGVIKNFWEFRLKNCVCYNGFNWILTKTGKDIVLQTLKNYAIVVQREDVFGDKNFQKIYETRQLEFTPEQKKDYIKLKSTAMLNDIVASSNMELRIKLQYFCNELKIQELNNILKEEVQDESCIICCEYRADIDKIKAVFPYAAVIHGDIVPEVRYKIFAEKPKILICQMKCIEFGLDLYYINYMIFFSNDYSYEVREQVEDRLLHMSKLEPSMYFDILVNDSIDTIKHSGLKQRQSASKIKTNVLL
jgi:SNF2 family DNA or RNA helicase